MLRITSTQMTALERDWLARKKAEIISTLHSEFPIIANCVGELSLARFVQQTMTACRTVWIDDVSQIIRVIRVAFILEYVKQDKKRQQYLGQILATEAEPEARVRFAEENLI